MYIPQATTTKIPKANLIKPNLKIGASSNPIFAAKGFADHSIAINIANKPPFLSNGFLLSRLLLLILKL